ncbi:MAG: hypothetical protein IKE70_04250 [Bacilli bacterium]|nr:hypothetical protein [Bacilli bacterium]
MKEKIKKNYKIIVAFILGLTISGIGAYAVSIASSSVSYDNTNSGATATDVKGAIDELYETVKTRIPQTPFKLGDYFTLVPDASTFTIKKETTGCDTDQTITPNELTLWRVIDIHSDGSVDAVSEYLSSTDVGFKGVQGYANFVGGLQTIAASYAKTGYTIATRMMGYAGQTSTIVDTSEFDGTIDPPTSGTSTPDLTTGTGQEYSGGVLGDTLYLKDYQLVRNVYKSDTTTYGSTGLKAYRVGTTTTKFYYLASRKFYQDDSQTRFYGRYVNSSGNITYADMMRYYIYHWSDGEQSEAVRPIITLKSDVSIASGSGTKDNPYILS